MTTATSHTVSRQQTVPRSSGRGAALAGTGTLIRFILRRDRVRLPIWIGLLTAASYLTLSSFTGAYPTAASRQNAAVLVENPALVAMVGRNYSPGDYTYGAMMGQQMLAFTAIFVALMGILLLVRHTRTDEEAGRAELVRATVVGRHAQLTASIVVVGGAIVVIGALTAIGMAAMNVESITPGGSALYGAALAAVGLAFVGITAITVQVFESGRAAAGGAGALLGVAYVLRAAGDVGDGTLSWLSPIGWAQATEVYVNDYWWPLAIAVVFTAATVVAGYVFSTRRDVGAGLKAPRPGRARAGTVLTRPLGLALRLHRGSLIGWSVAMLLLGASYGSVVSEVDTMMDDSEFFREMMAGLGGDFTASFLATISAVLAMAGGIYVILAVQRMRSEETAGRVEPLLATAVGRLQWAASHLVVALVGAVWLLLASGLGFGLTAAVSVGDNGLIGELLAAALAYSPALWVVGGVAMLLFGFVPRWTPLSWIVIIYAFVVVYFGPILKTPDWMNNLSPFGHVPDLPVASFDAVPLLILTAVAAAVVGAGLVGLRRRDIYTT